ncbi:MAG: halocyanin, partial [Clostridia bacterium]|nr:halocyanin [Clostridia bacterium]
MRKALIVILTLLAAAGLIAGCNAGGVTQPAPEKTALAATDTPAASATPVATETPAVTVTSEPSETPA